MGSLFINSINTPANSSCGFEYKIPNDGLTWEQQKIDPGTNSSGRKKITLKRHKHPLDMDISFFLPKRGIEAGYA